MHGPPCLRLGVQHKLIVDMWPAGCEALGLIYTQPNTLPTMNHDLLQAFLTPEPFYTGRVLDVFAVVTADDPPAFASISQIKAGKTLIAHGQATPGVSLRTPQLKTKNKSCH